MTYFIVADLSAIWGWGQTPQAAEARAWWNAEALDMLHEGPRLSLSDHRVPRLVWADRVELYECTEALYQLALAQSQQVTFRRLADGRMGTPQEAAAERDDTWL